MYLLSLLVIFINVYNRTTELHSTINRSIATLDTTVTLAAKKLQLIFVVGPILLRIGSAIDHRGYHLAVR